MQALHRLSILKGLVLVAILLPTPWLGVACIPEQLPIAPEVGALAPDFTITDIEGKPLILSVFPPTR